MSSFVKLMKPKINRFLNSVYLLQRNGLTRLAIIVAILLVLIAIFGPVFLPTVSEVNNMADSSASLLPPSGEHWFGTDELGRDLFLRVMLGTRISLSAGVITIAAATAIGVALGSAAGFFGGLLDDVIMRITDMFLGFPSLLLAMAIAAFMGPSLRNALIACIISWWPSYTRIVRNQAISVREKQFVKASVAIGAPPRFIILKHIIPNCLAPVIVQVSLDIGNVIMTLASLSFLGLGAQSPTPEWGLLVSTSRNYFLNAWWYTIFPGLAIFITVLVFNLIGDGLREIFDPRTRKN
ncbi:MAG TPA: ABC transporter permease [Candidatus Choladousia intestinipullorum]|nr:ABC transporter permease [Candidatus Choladousia intestinipullorum]